jgi:hypothetical protein
MHKKRPAANHKFRFQHGFIQEAESVASAKVWFYQNLCDFPQYKKEMRKMAVAKNDLTAISLDLGSQLSHT